MAVARPKRKLPSILFETKPARFDPQFWPFAALLLGFVAVISFCNIRSLDLWWHLKTGEWILHEHRIPRVDPFSHTAAGQPWISHEWLFGLLAYLAYAGAGVTGLVTAKALLIAGLFALAAWSARVRGASSAMIVLTLASCYAISRFRFTERPELLSTPLALGFLLVHEISRKRLTLILLLPLMQLLWVNIHGGIALLGWVLAGALLVDRALELHTKKLPWKDLLKHSDLRWHLVAGGGVVACSFVNPHGPKTLIYGMLRTESTLDNKEFQSLIEVARSGADLSIVLFVAFASLLVVFALTAPRTLRVYEWLLLPVLLVLTLVFFRFRPLFVFLLAPALAWQLSRRKWLDRVRWWVPTVVAILLMAWIALLERDAYFYRFGAGIHSGIFPVQAVEFVRQTRISGKMFNTYGLGGYLIWSLWPRTKVFIDGREDVYLRPGVLDEYLRCFDDRKRWQALVEKYGIAFAFVRYPESPAPAPDRSLEAIAFDRKEWALVYFDDVALVYARRNGPNDDIIRRHEIKLIQPLQLSSYLDPIVQDPEKLSLFFDEMRANLGDHPSSFRNHFNLGMLALKRGPSYLAEALEEFQRAVEYNPDFAPAYVNLGSIYLHLGRHAEAEAAFRKALALEHNPLAVEQLKLLGKLR